METEFDTSEEFGLIMAGHREVVRHAREFGIEENVVDIDGPMNLFFVTSVQVLSCVLSAAAFVYVYFMTEWPDMYDGICY